MNRNRETIHRRELQIIGAWAAYGLVAFGAALVLRGLGLGFWHWDAAVVAVVLTAAHVVLIRRSIRWAARARGQRDDARQAHAVLEARYRKALRRISRLAGRPARRESVDARRDRPSWTTGAPQEAIDAAADELLRRAFIADQDGA